uniref:Uncharacterized protein n=1 Tax=Anguilla anguilla TaxID=7936 RepID=A0A0E9QL37_ANGAN
MLACVHISGDSRLLHWLLYTCCFRHREYRSVAFSPALVHRVFAESHL